MAMYLPGAILFLYGATNFNHSSMRIVHLVKGHVVFVYWVDTVLVQNYLPTELSKRTVFIIYRKICIQRCYILRLMGYGKEAYLY